MSHLEGKTDADIHALGESSRSTSYKPSLVLERGEGMYVWSRDGKKGGVDVDIESL